MIRPVSSMQQQPLPQQHHAPEHLHHINEPSKHQLHHFLPSPLLCALALLIGSRPIRALVKASRQAMRDSICKTTLALTSMHLAEPQARSNHDHDHQQCQTWRSPSRLDHDRHQCHHWQSNHNHESRHRQALKQTPTREAALAQARAEGSGMMTTSPAVQQLRGIREQELLLAQPEMGHNIHHQDQMLRSTK